MGFLLALAFLTRIPVPLRRDVPPASWARSMAWFPLVGLIIGLLLVGCRWALRQLWPGDLASALTLAGWVALTGALHLDGYVDCSDALVVALPPARRLEILRDVHIGTYGLVATILLLLTKWLAVAHVPWQALLLAPVVGRGAMVLVTVAFPYARSEGLGRLFKDGVGPRELIVAALCALAAALIADTWRGLALLAIGWLTGWLLAGWSAHRLGGAITGDIYGATCEIVEVTVLLFAALLAWPDAGQDCIARFAPLVCAGAGAGLTTLGLR